MLNKNHKKDQFFLICIRAWIKVYILLV